MKLCSSEITKVFEDLGRPLDPELLKLAEEFEDEWTAKGVPDFNRLRLQLGLSARSLELKGCSRELLHEYLDAGLDKAAELMEIFHKRGAS